MTKLLITLSVAISALFLFSCIKEKEDKVKNYIEVGDPIPAFTVNGPFDSPYSTFSTRQFSGKKGMIVFFASYCDDCHVVMPIIDEVWKAKGELGEFDMAVISRLDGYETEKTVAKWWGIESGKLRFSMPYYLDEGRYIYDKFATKYIPRIYLVDSKGKVAKMWIEKMELTAEELIEIIKEI